MTSNKKNSDQRKPSHHPYNGWEFARDFSGGIFGLLNTGRVFPVFFLLLLAIMGLVVWRIPESDMGGFAMELFLMLRSSFAFMAFVCAVTNIGWFVIYRKQKKLYEAEISRLVADRKELLHHGVNLIPIKVHRSSDGEQVEGYIFPDIAKKV